MIEVPALEIQCVVREWAHPNQEKQHTAQTTVMAAIMKLENKKQILKKCNLKQRKYYNLGCALAVFEFHIAVLDFRLTNRILSPYWFGQIPKRFFVAKIYLRTRKILKNPREHRVLCQVIIRSTSYRVQVH